VASEPRTSAPLLGEPLPVDFMNTIWADRAGVHDALSTDAEVWDWLQTVQQRLAPSDTAVDHWLRVGTRSDLSDAGSRLRRLRDALRRLAADLTADPRPGAASAIPTAAEALDVLNRTAAAAPRWSMVEVTATHAMTRDTSTDVSPGTAVAGLLAEQAIDLFTGEIRSDLRACLAPGCVLYFVKHHPRREWCSTACGNRMRAARHYQRHHPGRA
jgi:predicted RNA-binding Zn ribbon-like protein